MTPLVAITAGDLAFAARFEESYAPRTCEAFRRLLPFTGNLIQARWSGEAAWVPLGDLDTGLSAENATSDPLPGQILFYPRGISETELLFPYGQAHFGSKAGTLSGNHFLTIVEGAERLAELGRRVLWAGAQRIVMESR